MSFDFAVVVGHLYVIYLNASSWWNSAHVPDCSVTLCLCRVPQGSAEGWSPVHSQVVSPAFSHPKMKVKDSVVKMVRPQESLDRDKKGVLTF